MLNCKITKPINPICDTAVSGIKKIAVLAWSETYKFNASAADCLVDTIDLGDANFLPIAVQDNSGSATAVISQGASKDAKAFNHTVSFIVSRLDCDLLKDWKNWMLGSVIFAVYTKNNQVLVFGIDNGLTATNFDYSTGAAEADQQGITAVFEGIQNNEPVMVKSWDVIRALFPETAKDTI